MFSAVLAIALGGASWFGIPIFAAVLGLALGVNAILRERKLAERQPVQLYLAAAGCLISGAALVYFFATRHG